jgi:NAD(P)-dependent dehydrogenase (short-subunit alcohol dehydrogenase family)
MSEFNDKVVLVAGAAGAIGREACRRYKEEGAILILIDNNAENLQQLKSYIGEDENTLYLEADCTDEEQVKQYVNKTVELYGSIDVFVHCIGVVGKVGPTHLLEKEDLDEVFQTNFVTAFLNHKYIYPVMEKQNYGSMLYVTALYAFYAVPHLTCYTFIYHAMNGFLKTAALEAAVTGVRVNALAPATTESPLMKDFEKKLFPSDPELGKQQILSYLPMARYVRPDEIAESILFCTSSKTNYLHGETHIIDGGYVVK